MEYTPPVTDPIILEPTEALEAVEELEATEFYSEVDVPYDFPEDSDDTPMSVLLSTLQPSEIVGMVLGLLFSVLGIIYLFTRLWI